MNTARLSKPEWDWITGTLEYVNEFSPPERATVESIRQQLDPKTVWQAPERPPIDEAVIESVLDRIEHVISNINWALKTYGLSLEGKHALVQARQLCADGLRGLGITGRWFETKSK